MKFIFQVFVFRSYLKPLLLLTFFFNQGISLIQAQEEEKKEENPSKVILFDLSKENVTSIKKMNLALNSRGPQKAGKSDPVDTLYKEGIIYSKNSTIGSFFGGPFNEQIPPQANLCMEGTFQLSLSPDTDTKGNKGGLRIGFKQPGTNGNAMSVRLYSFTSPKVTEPSLAVRVFSGPLLSHKSSADGATDEEDKEMIHSSPPKTFPINPKEPLRLKLMAHGATSEISVWINDQFIFKGKSAYKGVEGELCPLDFIDGFFVRFEEQSSFNDDNPASASSIICYYALD